MSYVLGRNDDGGLLITVSYAGRVLKYCKK